MEDLCPSQQKVWKDIIWRRESCYNDMKVLPMEGFHECLRKKKNPKKFAEKRKKHAELWNRIRKVFASIIYNRYIAYTQEDTQ